MKDIVHLSSRQVAELAEIFTAATESQRRARVCVDDGGLKIAVGAEVWTLPYGSLRDEPWF